MNNDKTVYNFEGFMFRVLDKSKMIVIQLYTDKLFKFSRETKQFTPISDTAYLLNLA